MKYGLKLWSTNANLIDMAVQNIDKKIFDYIELFVIPGTHVSPFVIDVPYIIHIPHHEFGVNIGDASIRKYNLQMINESIAWADKLDAKYLILHAGHGSMDYAKDLLREVADSRLLIENMPKVGLNDENMIGYSPLQIMELSRINDTGICLDFGHAAKAAVSQGEDYKEYIKGFLGFDPMVFHISDGRLSIEKDEHLNIGEGEYDIKYLMKCINKNNSKLITMETPRTNKNSLIEDVRNIEFLKKQF